MSGFDGWQWLALIYTGLSATVFVYPFMTLRSAGKAVAAVFVTAGLTSLIVLTATFLRVGACP